MKQLLFTWGVTLGYVAVLLIVGLLGLAMTQGIR